MQPLGERTVLLILIGAIGVSTLFCLIGLATPGWGGFSIFAGRHGSTAALSIISLLLLIGCIALAIIIMIGLIQHEHIPSLFVLLLIVTSLFLLGTFTSSVSHSAAYSFNLMVTAFAFTYLTSLGAVYWLFGLRGTNTGTTKSTVSSSPHDPI